ncbi:MAG TPA: hypothetical protein VG077_12525 [Verrucomicrobiae bacterium]|nr:hypothetical protein [Verrucomicrobiae bacterium]
MKRVHNIVGHYAKAPRRVTLPVGRYLVEAQANDYFRVSLPVTIESGQTTRVHLDDHWKPPADTPKTELVWLPNGNAVGWQAEPAKKTGVN